MLLASPCSKYAPRLDFKHSLDQEIHERRVYGELSETQSVIDGSVALQWPIDTVREQSRVRGADCRTVERMSTVHHDGRKRQKDRQCYLWVKDQPNKASLSHHAKYDLVPGAKIPQCIRDQNLPKCVNFLSGLLENLMFARP